MIFANSAFTAADVAATLGFPRERIVVAHPGIGAESAPDGEAAERAAPYLLTVATLEPRKNLGTLVEAFALLGDSGLELCVVGRRGLGRAAAARPARASSRLGRVPDEELAAPLPRRRRGRLPVPLRGLRDADHRGDGLRRARRRLRPSLARRGLAARRRSASTPRAPEAIAGAIREALERREQLRALGFAHAASFSWRRTGELFLEGYRRFS